ncbi:hypothetical protein ACFWXO_08140 [Kitasatospora sp. NPDC059088]|uniref:hypothetical protein n=1 Tax=Kitasatospora sp. NPDC059088 TaxID=3346722 RepID=UPI0036A0F20F
MSALNDFATWEPLLRLLRSAHAEKLAAPGGYVAGVIGRGSSTVPLKWRSPEPGRASLLSDYQAQHDAIRRVRAVVPDTGSGGVAFTVEIAPEGRAVLRLFDLGPAAGSGPGNAHPRVLVRAEGAVPEPWRRRPEPVPGVRSAPSVDPEALERTLRERIPGAIGATEEEIAAAEARLGVARAPVLALPRLRTLSASPGTLADPREVGRLSGLEFVALTPEDWRVLLDAGAVPHSLSAAAITVNGDRDPRRTIALANEILALWDRPLITETVVHGDLGPLPTSGPESTAGRGGEPQPLRPAGERQGLGRVLPGLPGTPEPGPGPGADG